MSELSLPHFRFDHVFLNTTTPEAYLELGVAGFEIDPTYFSKHADSAISKAVRFHDSYLEYVELPKREGSEGSSNALQPGFSVRSELSLSDLLKWCRENELQEFGPEVSQGESKAQGMVSKFGYLTFEKPLTAGIEFWVTEYETERTWNPNHPNSAKNFIGAIWDLPPNHPIGLFLNNCDDFQINPEAEAYRNERKRE